MAEVTEYSDVQQNVIKAIHEGDNGFHTGFYIADLPLYDMISEDDEGNIVTKYNIDLPLNLGSEDYILNVRYSEEQKCWFFNLSYGSDSFSGILHFNTLYNARGIVSFVVLNDIISDVTEDITHALPYSNVMVLRK